MRLLKDLLTNFLEWSFEKKANKMFVDEGFNPVFLEVFISECSERGKKFLNKDILKDIML